VALNEIFLNKLVGTVPTAVSYLGTLNRIKFNEILKFIDIPIAIQPEILNRSPVGIFKGQCFGLSIES
jgi:hypothetical protein